MGKTARWHKTAVLNQCDEAGRPYHRVVNREGCLSGAWHFDVDLARFLWNLAGEHWLPPKIRVQVER